MITYEKGINLGGWISQYKSFSSQHFDTFIQEKDIEILAKAGFDHVRLPFDYPVIESDDQPGVYKESGLKYIDDCLTWCKARNMGVVLDLHHAPGYRFQDLATNTLFVEREKQNRFIHLWTFLTNRYILERDHIVFELLNEIVEPDSSRWNKLMLETIEAIRKLDKTRMIYVGGNNYNSPSELKNIANIEDDYIVYNFHFYNPFFFTHQKASWSQSAMDYNKNVIYPGVYEGMEDFIASRPEYDYMKDLINLQLDKELLRKELRDALEFQKEHQCRLYCGEYGVIALTDLESRIRWHADYVSLLREYGIGSACWSYKEMDFEIYANDGKLLDQRFIDIMTQ